MGGVPRPEQVARSGTRELRLFRFIARLSISDYYDHPSGELAGSRFVPFPFRPLHHEAVVILHATTIAIAGNTLVSCSTAISIPRGKIRPRKSLAIE